MIIRSGGEADIAAISALHTASWRSAYDEILPAWYLTGLSPVITSIAGSNDSLTRLLPDSS